MSARLHHAAAAAALALALGLTLAACSDNADQAAGHSQLPGRPGDPSALPTPHARGGSVTGMPEAGQPGASGIVLGSREPAPAADDASAATDPPAPPSDAGDGTLSGIDGGAVSADGDAVPADPGTGDAMRLLRDYFARLNARDVAAARAMWDGQWAPQQLLPPDVAGISAQIGTPGRVDAGAGQRYVEVPVTIEQTLLDGRTRRVSGIYTLHASVVEGAKPGWRITGEQLR